MKKTLMFLFLFISLSQAQADPIILDQFKPQLKSCLKDEICNLKYDSVAHIERHLTYLAKKSEQYSIKKLEDKINSLHFDNNVSSLLLKEYLPLVKKTINNI